MSRNLLIDVILLADRDDVVHEPVKDKSRREPPEEEREEYRHKHHHLRLHGITAGRGHLLLDHHRGAHDQRQYPEREVIAGHVEGKDIFRRGQIVNPEHEGRMAELDGRHEDPVEREEDRYLYHHGKAAAERVDAFLLINAHHLLV